MKIVLKYDWDIPISPPLDIEDSALLHAAVEKEIGHYGGRWHESNKLVNELLRKPKGSILISGYRGVGKTSLVYKALLELKKKNNEIIIVMLNAAHLEAGLRNDPANAKILSQTDPQKIIQNLIRRLYSTTKGSELPDNTKADIDKLYKMAVAAEFNVTERYQNQEKFQQIEVKERKLDYMLNKNLLTLIFIGVLSTALQYSNFISADWLAKLIPVLVAFFGPLTLFYKTQKNKSEDKSLTKSADEVYRSDNCIGNLEFELEKIHKDLYYKCNKKIIYIIDELDKLNPQNQVDEILNYFKNFFTLSNAIFVFIGGQELYDRYLQNSDRSINYTYFTSKYFVSRPSWAELDSYLDNIIQFSDIEEERLNILKRALCFEARNDFFI